MWPIIVLSLFSPCRNFCAENFAIFFYEIKLLFTLLLYFIITILKPLAGQTTTYVHNAATFCDEIKRFTIDDTEVMVSHYVVSPFTKVPIQQAQQKYEKDAKLTQRTQLSAAHLMELCSLRLKSTVFTFREKFYAQTEGLPMDSPLYHHYIDTMFLLTYLWKTLRT